MKVFIFGAGASVDAQNQVTYTKEHPEKAPLVNDLFNEQYKEMMVNGLNFDIEECRRMIKETGALEKWLSSKWDAINSLKTDRAKKAEKSWFGNINLYIWNLLNRVSKTYPNSQGYSIFLKKLYDEEFGIISFNYDTLLDQSYEDVFGVSLKNKEDYLNGNFVKLHGSVNWFLRKRSQEHLPWQRHRGDISVRIRAIAENMYNGDPMTLDSLEIIDPKHSVLSNLDAVMNYFNDDGYFYPLLFMPLTGKDYSIIVDFKSIMIEKAEAMLRKATDVYLIGYRANDDLIRVILEQVRGGTNLHVVGLSSAQEISNRIVSSNGNLKQGIINDKGFSNFASTF